MQSNLQKTAKEINGHKYEIMSFPAIYNYNLATKFGSMVGASFRSIGATIGSTIVEQDAAIGMAELGSSIHKLLDALHAKDPKGDFMLEIMAQTTRDGKAVNKVTFDEFYTGNMKEMTAALIATIKVHFEGFFPEGGISGLLSAQESIATESLES